MTRREWAQRTGLALASARMLPEFAYAQRAAVTGKVAANMVWLNGNEFPEGPPEAVVRAMADIIPTSNRYHYQEFRDFYRRLAASEDLAPENVLVGAGSSEVLHAAVDAFTSDTRPLIAPVPTYEGPLDLVRSMKRQVVRVSLSPSYAADVKKLVAAADKAGGGLIYLCNPNNPTSAVTTKADLAWLVANLPPQTVALIDEAYLHFTESPEVESALGYVRQGKPVVVTRTFSKIYGMAGLRVGFAAARPDLITQMEPFRNNVISIVSVRAVLAALDQSKTLIPERRAKLSKTRRELCAWLRDRKVPYIEPNANFIMIDVQRDARHFIQGMPERGVAVGRPFPPLTNMLRVTIGTDQEMEKFREAFWSLHQA